MIDDLPLAGFAQPEARGEAVVLHIFSEIFETAVAVARSSGRVRVDFVKIGKYSFNRAVQAVQIEAVEASFLLGRRQQVVAVTQPADEVQHVGIAPHPGREAPEVGEGLIGCRVCIESAHEMVDAIRIRPIGLHSDCSEPQFLDEPLADVGARSIELVRTM